MAWPYLLVFLGALLFDVVPFPFLPAFTVMIFLQVHYGLPVWPVLFIGVTGSILGRYLLTLYIPFLSDKYFKPAKNEDVQFLGEQLKARGWKSQLFIVGYSLLPLPTTPLFLAGGMARIGSAISSRPFSWASSPATAWPCRWGATRRRTWAACAPACYRGSPSWVCWPAACCSARCCLSTGAR